MNILFVHQNYDTQYKHILQWLARSGQHTILFLTQRTVVKQPSNHRIISYQPDHVPRPDVYAYSAEFERCSAVGVKVAERCRELDHRGFKPDIIIGHSGWEELLFIKDVWPDTPLFAYFEYFYSAENGAVGFDPEFPISDPITAGSFSQRL